MSKYISKLAAIKNDNGDIIGMQSKLLRNSLGAIVFSKEGDAEFRATSASGLFDVERTRVRVASYDGTIPPSASSWYAHVLSPFEISIYAMTPSDEVVLADFNTLDFEIVNF